MSSKKKNIGTKISDYMRNKIQETNTINKLMRISMSNHEYKKTQEKKSASKKKCKKHRKKNFKKKVCTYFVSLYQGWRGAQ